MQEKIQEKEEPVIKLLKVVFTFVAVISVVFVFYNIAMYTDSQEIKVSAGLENGL